MSNEYEINLRQWINDNNIRVGDKVKLMTTWRAGEHGYFPDCTPGNVRRISGESRYLQPVGTIDKLETSNVWIRFDDTDGRTRTVSYPYFIMSRISSRDEHVHEMWMEEMARMNGLKYGQAIITGAQQGWKPKQGHDFVIETEREQTLILRKPQPVKLDTDW